VEPDNKAVPDAAEAAAAVSGATGFAGAVAKLKASRHRLSDLRDRGLGKLQRGLGLAGAMLPPSPLGALCGVADALPLTAENLLLGYAQGIFAMDFDGKVRWRCPPERFVVYLSELRISTNMRRELKRASYTTSFDQAPRQVLDACADRAEGTWLSERFKRIYMELFDMGAMHTVEAWKEGELVGGSFGVSIGRIWTSESMFHRAPHAGKVQFAAVAAHLIERGYVCVDGQMYSEHFARFGAREIPIAEYRDVLARGLANPARFHAEEPKPATPVAGPPAQEKKAKNQKQRARESVAPGPGENGAS
jgi:leucyl/phenylalanyl-tRNA--protein transferase